MFDPDAFDKMSNDFELEALRKEISKLEAEVKMLKKVIHDNDLSDEIGEVKPVSPEEEVCTLGIDVILQLVKNKTFTKNDIQNFDIFHKNLRMIRGESTEEVKDDKPIEVGELLKLVKEMPADEKAE
jgi:hypothetical protein